MNRAILLLVCIVLFAACRPPVYTPKPRGYYQVVMPAKAYQTFERPGFPYSFDYPTYGNILQDTNLAGPKELNRYSIDIDFPELGGRIYLDYKSITPTQSLERLLYDAHEMSYFHTKRADYINAPSFKNTHGVHGLFVTVGGNAASAYQFIATDSTKHFLRGALYFDATPNADSLKPVAEFLKRDMEHMLETLQWK